MDELHMQKQIGEGSFGKVYLAKWKETTVAVKVLTSTAGNDDEDFPIGLPNPLLQALTKARARSTHVGGRRRPRGRPFRSSARP